MAKRTAIGVAAAVILVAGAARAADLPAALIDPYLQVQAALASDTLDGVAGHAQSIAKAAGTLGADAAPIAAAADTLAKAGDLEAARNAFGEVSSALLAYAEKTKSGLGPDVRIAFCPMAKKSWLTKDKTIRNPYYGSAMLTCGSFK